MGRPSELKVMGCTLSYGWENLHRSPKAQVPVFKKNAQGGLMEGGPTVGAAAAAAAAREAAVAAPADTVAGGGGGPSNAGTCLAPARMEAADASPTPASPGDEVTCISPSLKAAEAAACWSSIAVGESRAGARASERPPRVHFFVSLARPFFPLPS
jgi:hypothetical protein